MLPSQGRHDTVDRALRFRDLGVSAITSVPTDAGDRMDLAALSRLLAADGDHDSHTREAAMRIQQDGTTSMGGTTWRGRAPYLLRSGPGRC
ncbi:hypothetical protein SAMN06265360_111101 [Haloechinothrix alba]|uniref:Uncharacterized protein n=1 Tax=Haloechinothrix alba TaxID=664784 RepID=A0A238XLZ4_9PSEU|nr:hypothetical protein [Haloechinothrix alba]SNR59611.1 hypothetical protein SAMN06265360_111101 [Haloechinothrix alba]